MNSTKEMIKFADYLFLNDMSSNSILLWYTLRNIGNWVKGKDCFQVPNQTLQQLTGFTDTKLTEARNTLVKKKLIHYKKGKKGTDPTYQMIPFVQFPDRYTYQSQDQFQEQSQEQSQAQFQNQSQDLLQEQSTSEALFIYNKESLKRRRRGRRGRRGGRGASDELFSVYEQNFETLRPIVEEGLDKWCEDLGEEIVLEAIHLAVKNGAQKYSYIEKILKQWTGHHLRTLQQVRDFVEKQRSTPDSILSFSVKSKQAEASVFDELRREVSAE